MWNAALDVANVSFVVIAMLISLQVRVMLIFLSSVFQSFPAICLRNVSLTGVLCEGG